MINLFFLLAWVIRGEFKYDFWTTAPYTNTIAGGSTQVSYGKIYFSRVTLLNLFLADHPTNAEEPIVTEYGGLYES